MTRLNQRDHHNLSHLREVQYIMGLSKKGVSQNPLGLLFPRRKAGEVNAIFGPISQFTILKPLTRPFWGSEASEAWGEQCRAELPPLQSTMECTLWLPLPACDCECPSVNQHWFEINRFQNV